MKYLVMGKIYTDVCGIKQLYYVCPPVRKIIHSLKFVNYLVFAMSLCKSVYMCFVVTCWERADLLLALVCGV